MRDLGFLPALLLLATACPSTGVGRPCDVQAATAANGATLNGQALECPTGICLHQARAPGSAAAPDTAAFCTTTCTTDADCAEGETRDPGQAGDRRCRSGFTCGVAVSTGSVACCRKLCLCRDFLAGPAAAPTECDPHANPTVCPSQPLE